MNKLIGIILVTFMIIVPYQIAAADSDESSALLCSVIEVFECSLESDCSEVTAESANLPLFTRIDFENMKLMAPKGSEEKRESIINSVQKSNGSILLQGIGHGRAWSIAISQESGVMTATVSEDEGGFVVFGACILDY